MTTKTTDRSHDLTDDIDVVGQRIRSFREEKGMSLRKLAEQSDLSVGFLSQVERGLSSIALSSLRAVAAALGRPMADFFAQPNSPEKEPEGVVFTLNRAAEHTERVVSGGRHYEMLSARVPGLVLEPMLVYIEPGGVKEEASSHAGEEFAYVIQGELSYEVAGVTHRLGVGDSLHLRSNTPHSLHNDTDELTVVVSVVTPRLF
ncbi:cupin domain-containing protein [Herbiconiux daphne]|uniref:Cupin domain-containing protein n=1 Tax=Herbiconiux daphne TaxID=2970914 RepID=A0ABT2H3B0_9MICO|nr:cupin domain-containing protein [Herbiconiux daphne]MCS5734421.1 cupin domain-containing protein [Herbiconiux daphne]